MREDQVENGVKFMVHPKVKTAPLSQRISFLEGKGLTPEEISAALSRVDGQSGHGDIQPALLGDAGRGYDNGRSLSSAATFATEAEVPLWRKAALPGALVLGAVGALGTYHIASRMAGNLNGTQSNPAVSSAAVPEEGSGLTNSAGVSCDGVAYAQDGSSSQPSLVDQGVHPEYSDQQEVDQSSPLVGEFRRLTEAMEQQTGHLVEAVTAMKALASRAEQDSSSLLAARVSSHTSELRAEIGTIKQLLLLRAGESSGPVADGAAVSSADTARGKNAIARGADAMDEQLLLKGKTGESKAYVAPIVPVKATEVMGGTAACTAAQSEGMEDKMENKKAEEDEAAAEVAARAVMERRKEVARTALSALLANNAPQAAKDGIAMLRMLVANLVKHPNVPRYRRIATSNDNFKKRLLPLEGHRAMMEAIGFKAKGSLWEWTWHEDSGPLASSTNKAILEGVITAIDAVARPNGPPMPTSSQPIAVRSTSPPASLSESSAAYTDVKTSISFNGRPDLKGNVWGANGQARKSEFSWDRPGVADSSAVAVMSAGGGVDAQGVKDGVACAAMADKKSLVLAKTVANTLSGGTAHEDGRPNENGRPVASLAEEPVLSSDNKSSKLERTTSFEETDASGAKATVSIVDDPGSPPTSLAEVAAVIQRGENPPGIRVVEDRLSVDAPSLTVTSKPSPPKPWEAVSGSGTTAGMLECSLERAGGRSVGCGDNGSALPSSEPPPSPQRAVSVGP